MRGGAANLERTCHDVPAHHYVSPGEAASGVFEPSPSYGLRDRRGDDVPARGCVASVGVLPSTRFSRRRHVRTQVFGSGGLSWTARYPGLVQQGLVIYLFFVCFSGQYAQPFFLDVSYSILSWLHVMEWINVAQNRRHVFRGRERRKANFHVGDCFLFTPSVLCCLILPCSGVRALGLGCCLLRCVVADIYISSFSWYA